MVGIRRQFAAAGLVAAWTVLTVVAPGQAGEAPRRIGRQSRNERIQKIADHLTKTYARHLRDRDPVVRCLAVIGLGRLAGEKTTSKLLLTAAGDRDEMVRLFAWEALRARAQSLDGPARRRWLLAGLNNARRGMVKGDFRAHVLAALRPEGPAGFNGQVRRWMLRVLADCDPTDPDDAATLTGIRRTVAAWQDPNVIRRLAVLVGGGGTKAHVAEYALGGLTDRIEPIGSIQPDRKISDTQWAQARQAWLAWLREQRPTPARPEELPAYEPEDLLLGPAEMIEDPGDPKWRQDLELDKLRIDRLEVCFAIDSTGSMSPAMKWVAAEVIRMAKLFGTVSREVRIGAVFFRDTPSGVAGDYLVKGLKLTSDIRELARDLAGEPAGGGRGRGAAMLEALQLSIRKQNWSPMGKSRRVVILVSDTFPVAGTEEKIEELLKTAAAEQQFVVHTIRVAPQALVEEAEDRYLPKLAQIAAAGGGTSIVQRFRRSGRTAGRPVGKGSWPQIARPDAAGGDCLDPLVTAVVRSILPEDYWKRVQPLVRVMLKLKGRPTIARSG